MPYCVEWCTEREDSFDVFVQLTGEEPTLESMQEMCQYFGQLRHLPKMFHFHLDTRPGRPLALLPFLPLFVSSIRNELEKLGSTGPRCRTATVYLQNSVSSRVASFVSSLFQEITSIELVCS